MNNTLNLITTAVYDKCCFDITDFHTEKEGKDYNACTFEINKLKIICRNAKTTPKKLGQFVTFWKRDENHITMPYEETDDFDYYVINVRTEIALGQFVLPKAELIQRGLISTSQKQGKRGFRVYPQWVSVQNKQAEKTQKWQLNYFYHIDDNLDIHKVRELYHLNEIKYVEGEV